MNWLSAKWFFRGAQAAWLIVAFYEWGSGGQQALACCALSICSGLSAKVYK